MPHPTLPCPPARPGFALVLAMRTAGLRLLLLATPKDPTSHIEGMLLCGHRDKHLRLIAPRRELQIRLLNISHFRGKQGEKRGSGQVVSAALYNGEDVMLVRECC